MSAPNVGLKLNDPKIKTHRLYPLSQPGAPYFWTFQSLLKFSSQTLGTFFLKFVLSIALNGVFSAIISSDWLLLVYMEIIVFVY